KSGRVVELGSDEEPGETNVRYYAHIDGEAVRYISVTEPRFYHAEARYIGLDDVAEWALASLPSPTTASRRGHNPPRRRHLPYRRQEPPHRFEGVGQSRPRSRRGLLRQLHDASAGRIHGIVQLRERSPPHQPLHLIEQRPR